MLPSIVHERTMRIISSESYHPPRPVKDVWASRSAFSASLIASSSELASLDPAHTRHTGTKPENHALPPTIISRISDWFVLTSTRIFCISVCHACPKQGQVMLQAQVTLVSSYYVLVQKVVVVLRHH